MGVKSCARLVVIIFLGLLRRKTAMPKIPQRKCIACSGSGRSSKGFDCVPCHGTGKRKEACEPKQKFKKKRK